MVQEREAIRHTSPRATRFFSGLAAWGDTIWQLWTHNKGVDGAAPFLMAQATVGTQQGCDTLFPESLSATSGHTQVTLEWSAVSGATGYKVYYDQAGKAQLIHDTLNDLDPLVTTLTDTGLTNGIEYCYKVTAYADMACESGYSNIVCAIPTNQGQTSTPAGVSSLTTGIISGKGNNTSFSEQTEFWPGDTISIQALVWDELNNIVLPDATVELLVTGPESFTIVSGLSDSSGVALAEWNTNVCGDYYPVVLNILIRKISRKGGS